MKRKRLRLALPFRQSSPEKLFLILAQVQAEIVSCAVKQIPEFAPYWAIAEQPGLKHPLWQGFTRN